MITYPKPNAHNLSSLKNMNLDCKLKVIWHLTMNLAVSAPAPYLDLPLCLYLYLYTGIGLGLVVDVCGQVLVLVSRQVKILLTKIHGKNWC